MFGRKSYPEMPRSTRYEAAYHDDIFVPQPLKELVAYVATIAESVRNTAPTRKTFELADGVIAYQDLASHQGISAPLLDHPEFNVDFGVVESTSAFPGSQLYEGVTVSDFPNGSGEIRTLKVVSWAIKTARTPRLGDVRSDLPSISPGEELIVHGKVCFNAVDPESGLPSAVYVDTPSRRGPGRAPEMTISTFEDILPQAAPWVDQAVMTVRSIAGRIQSS